MAGEQPSVAQLRPALDLALDVARAAGSDRSGLSVPGRVRSLAGARRLRSDWAVTMRQVLDGDDAFRTRVGASALEADLGRLSWLWLTRPEGWVDQLDEILAEEMRARELTDRERELVRDREEAERMSVSLRSDLDGARAVNARLLSEADRLRAVASEATSARRSLEARVSVIEHERSSLSGQLAETGERAREAGDDVDRLREELAATRVRAEWAEAGCERLQKRIDSLEAGQRESAVAHRLVADEAALQRLGAAEALTRALEATVAMNSALEAAAELLGASGGRGRGESPGVPGHRLPTEFSGDPPPFPPAGASKGERPRERRGPHRRRIALPPALLDDSPEAARHMLRTPGAVLMVDGYNVALTSWPGGDLPALRDRLVSALAELVVRVRIQVAVYFDGEGDGGREAPPPVARPWMRVYFSASSREADEEIVGAIEALDPDVAVVVATDDAQVRRDAVELGASVISVAQLLGVLGRRPGSTG